MKKKICLALTLCLACSGVYGCSKKETSSSSVALEGAQETTTNPLSYNPDDYVTVGEYKNLNSYDVACTVSDEELEEEIEYQLSSYAQYTDITDRGAKENDYITIDYSTTVDGKEVEDCQETDFEMPLGEGYLNNKIEKALIGKKAGESFTLDMKIPEDLSGTNAGDMGTFNITVKSLQLETIPELNLDFVQSNTEYETVEEFKEGAKEDILAYKDQEIFSELVYDMLDQVIANSTFTEDYPQELYDACKEEVYAGYEASAEIFGMEVDEYLKDFCGYEDQDIEEEILATIKQRLVIYSIALKEDLMVSDEEYTEYAESVAAEFGYTEVSELEEEYSKDEIWNSAVFDNVTALLYENASLTEMSEEEYYEATASEEAEEADAADEEEIELEETE